MSKASNVICPTKHQYLVRHFIHTLYFSRYCHGGCLVWFANPPLGIIQQSFSFSWSYFCLMPLVLSSPEWGTQWVRDRKTDSYILKLCQEFWSRFWEDFWGRNQTYFGWYKILTRVKAVKHTLVSIFWHNLLMLPEIWICPLYESFKRLYQTIFCVNFRRPFHILIRKHSLGSLFGSPDSWPWIVNSVSFYYIDYFVSWSGKAAFSKIRQSNATSFQKKSVIFYFWWEI